jgi:hypothetical protein
VKVGGFVGEGEIVGVGDIVGVGAMVDVGEGVELLGGAVSGELLGVTVSVAVPLTP